MTAFTMEAGRENFGAGAVESLRRFLYRVAAGLAILFLIVLLLVLLVPMAILGMLYFVVRSVFSGFGRGARHVEAPAHQPIPVEDGEGRENVRVRRPDAE